MTLLAPTPLLFEDLPLQRAPAVRFLDLHTLVPLVFDLYPDWGEEDVRNFVEEKTLRPVSAEDLTTLRTVYQRCLRLRSEFEG